jgi:uncharacterized membrane protein YqaE (UPF0057 family)
MSDGALLVTMIVCGYFIPACIGYARGQHQRAAILVLNLLLGWTLLGWVGALIWAFTAVQRQQA